MKAPKRRSESVYNPNWEAPDKEWLEHQLCTLGKSVDCVADEVYANRKTVGNWVDNLGVSYWGHRKKPIPAGLVPPRRVISSGGRVTWYPPSREWLVTQHHKHKKSVNRIAEELRTTHDVVYRWFGRAGVERIKRYPEGLEHVFWKDTGHSRPRSHARKVLRLEGELEKCAWCGTTSKVQVHHVDHNPDNNLIENLKWLCYHCNLLEAHLWHLWKQGKVDLQCEDRTIVINFK